MDLVLCHTTADFDTLGAAVGVTLLNPAARIVLGGGCHPTVQAFLALHRDEYPLIERRAVNLDAVEAIAVVDTQSLKRLGPLGDWVTTVAARGGQVHVYDHHQDSDRSLPATAFCVEAVGAATTLLVERLQAQHITLNTSQATVMALGIHVDTGSLTFTSSTVRDAAALAWLMGQGVSQSAIAEFVEPNLSPPPANSVRNGDRPTPAGAAARSHPGLGLARNRGSRARPVGLGGTIAHLSRPRYAAVWRLVSRQRRREEAGDHWAHTGPDGSDRRSPRH